MLTGKDYDEARAEVVQRITTEAEYIKALGQFRGERLRPASTMAESFRRLAEALRAGPARPEVSAPRASGLGPGFSRPTRA